ncbi:bifunctional alpha,alpha-trehalose-phosphate synthase (UDP-forming)/trehalose-phosphatase [Leucobacter sp. cx-169]|nr:MULTISPECIES: bifunctional alpha,alpha-trehalose-phosphate synthase (UDP-forming)/trehalose-phosphatase [unclassified Leucobacter]MBC9927739.1 bifunctional alpha,alpha-trehalose-phosphate synthase (UDP-forming)/trehalose-phosphatase [Leucobacter sp. cx-169]
MAAEWVTWSHETEESESPSRPLVVVANRLPVDRVADPDGGPDTWRTSPGGLVTAMEPVVRELGCTWVGWAGGVDEATEPFQAGGFSLQPVALSTRDLEEYYEGFSNDTIWPLYHDVISPPQYHREWWERYREVNERFAAEAAAAAEHGATVWIHDYQLQLVPAMLREKRPDLVIAFFLHIPFPANGIFSQLPWRRQILEGLLGADLIGFQRVQDAANFRSVVRRILGVPAHGNVVSLPEDGSGEEPRRVVAQEFPISIDVRQFVELTERPEVQQRAAEIRAELGNPKRVILGVDRLDYTKGIRHRLKAYAEMLADGSLEPGETVLVQVASPSRERVVAYQQLRDEIELTVSRINGDHGAIGYSPVVYLHRGYPREEMAALYLAADVLAVTALRDGMNLVAKEYVACRTDGRGALVLSEFAGAADELSRAVIVNPHDIEGLKAGLLKALHMPEEEQRRRMHVMQRTLNSSDVLRWSSEFLRAVDAAARGPLVSGPERPQAAPPTRPIFLPTGIDAALRRLATAPAVLIALDFDGTLAHLVSRPEDARILPRSERALEVLQEAPGVRVALVSGRSLESLASTGVRTTGRILAGSHGAELRWEDGSGDPAEPTEEEFVLRDLLEVQLEQALGHIDGLKIERKPYGVGVHTRRVADREAASAAITEAERIARSLADAGHPLRTRHGKEVIEMAVRDSDKGAVLTQIRDRLPEGPVLFIGDDVTDEDGFRALRPGDVGVRVGPGESAAEFRVADPDEAGALLARLTELRTDRVIGSEGLGGEAPR